jgi:ferredoxin-NADP reductase
MIEAILRDEPGSTIHLVYGNRSASTTMYRRRIRDLSASSAGRFHVRFVDEHGNVDDVATTHIGQLDEQTLRLALPSTVTQPNTVVFLCGPAVVMANARRVFAQRGIIDSQILEEKFGSPQAAQLSGRATHSATVFVGATRYQFPVAPSLTLLDAAQAANVPMPSSCTMGGCGACAITVDQGELSHDEPNCLSASERSKGKALACVARLASDCTVRVNQRGPR